MGRLERYLDELDNQRLRALADARILRRSRAYVDRIEQLGRIGDDTLAGWIKGHARYATAVRVLPDQRIQHACTCPYAWGTCKHVLAILQAGTARVRAGRPIHQLDAYSPLHAALEGQLPAARAPRSNTELASPPTPTDEMDELARRLRRSSRDDLLRHLQDMAARFPDAGHDLLQTLRLGSGDIDAAATGLRGEISALLGDATADGHAAAGTPSDLRHIRTQLESLADAGHADIVVALGETLWTAATATPDAAADAEVRAAMAPVLRALGQSSLSGADQLLWVIDRRLQDDRGLLGGDAALLAGPEYTPGDWRQVADVLYTRLRQLPPPDPMDAAARGRRVTLLDHVLMAQRRSARPDASHAHRRSGTLPLPWASGRCLAGCG